jgi:hypothetical protein
MSEPARPLLPLLIEGNGRDGTTLMMQLLGTAPEIAFDRIYPFERRYFSYFLALARIPDVREWDEDSWDIDHLANPATLLGERNLVGPIPWVGRKLIDGGEDARASFSRRAFELLWGEFSERVRAVIREEANDPELEVSYYAQKLTGGSELELGAVPALKIITLMRDPRDTWLSTLAFNARMTSKGLPAFMRLAPGETKEHYLERFIEGHKGRFEWLRTLEGDERILMAKYETLIDDLHREADRIGDWLGVSLNAQSVLDASDEMRYHMTSASARHSVGRWRHEMGEPEVELFQRELGREMRAFGYET